MICCVLSVFFVCSTMFYAANYLVGDWVALLREFFVMLVMTFLVFLVASGYIHRTLKEDFRAKVSVTRDEGTQVIALERDELAKTVIVDVASKETQTINDEVTTPRKGKKFPITNVACGETQTDSSNDEKDKFIRSLLNRLQLVEWDNSLLQLNNKELKRYSRQREKDMAKMAKDYERDLEEVDKDIEELMEENAELKAESKAVRDSNVILAACINEISKTFGITDGDAHVAHDGDASSSTEKEYSDDSDGEIEYHEYTTIPQPKPSDADTDALIDELYNGY